MPVVLANRGMLPPIFPVLLILTSSLPSATTGSAYSTTLSATGGVAPYTWSIASASPNTGNWLSISSGGVLSGTPGTAETETLNIQVQDSRGITAQHAYTLTVNAAVNNLIIYANGVSDSNFTQANAITLSFNCTLDFNNTVHVTAGHTKSLQVAWGTNGGGYQPGSNWTTIPPNGFDNSPYVALQFDVYTPVPTEMYVGAHYARSTGNDINASTSAPQASGVWVSVPANTFTTVTVLFSNLAFIGARNSYKFVIGTSHSSAGTFWLDNIKFVPGSWILLTDGISGAPIAGWTDATTGGTADYTWLPQSLNPGTGGLFSLNNPPLAASSFTASSSGTVLTVTAMDPGSTAILAGDTFCPEGNLGGNPLGVINAYGSGGTTGTGGVGTYQLSASSSWGSQHWATSPSQNIIQGIKLTNTAINPKLKLTTSSLSVSAYKYLTFGFIPTKAGFGLMAQLLDTSGVPIGSEVNALSYTINNFGVTNQNFTVCNVPLTALGNPSSIGGLTLRESSSNTNNTTYFSALGFMGGP